MILRSGDKSVLASFIGIHLREDESTMIDVELIHLTKKFKDVINLIK